MSDNKYFNKLYTPGVSFDKADKPKLKSALIKYLHSRLITDSESRVEIPNFSMDPDEVLESKWETVDRDEVIESHYVVIVGILLDLYEAVNSKDVEKIGNKINNKFWSGETKVVASMSVELRPLMQILIDTQ